MTPSLFSNLGVVVARDYKAAVLRRFARWGSAIWNSWERHQVTNYGLHKPEHAPVFIVGAPRTGSTILYQLLSHQLDVLYIDNFTAMFYRHLLCGLRLSEIFYHSRPHYCFRSIQGDTRAYGLHGPSECGDFWYRWLPRDKHYIGADELPMETVQQIRSIIFSAINRWGKPFLFKNLNAGQRMALIQQIAPEAKFIFITRDPLYTAQSIWQVREKMEAPAHQWWSIMPKNVSQLLLLEPAQMIAAQVFYLEKQIVADQKLFPKEQFTTISYESLCKRPFETLERLRQFIGDGVRERVGLNSLPSLSLNETQKIAAADFYKLETAVSQYDWENYEFD
jgi:Sulfotransferase family